ncbi:hypothetical protein LTR64_008131 [Lithohypha guttulata]|uniref:uncharacterized protein n=1 Tax=Lithohypha guttulata TaxID=1690604 RepID=UPI00315DB0F0
MHGLRGAGTYDGSPSNPVMQRQRLSTVDPTFRIVAEPASAAKKAYIVSKNRLLPATTRYNECSEARIDWFKNFQHGAQRTIWNTPKLVHAAEKAFADRSLLLDENQLLFEQNNKKVTRTSTRSTITGTARVMTYDDTIAAEQRRDVKGHGQGSRQKQPIDKRSSSEKAGMQHEERLTE